MPRGISTVSYPRCLACERLWWSIGAPRKEWEKLHLHQTFCCLVIWMLISRGVRRSDCVFLNSIGITALTQTCFERAANKSQTLRHSAQPAVPSPPGANRRFQPRSPVTPCSPHRCAPASCGCCAAQFCRHRRAPGAAQHPAGCVLVHRAVRSSSQKKQQKLKIVCLIFSNLIWSADLFLLEAQQFWRQRC